jgi:drug/metabolite transporter (DMT)-like permease
MMDVSSVLKAGCGAEERNLMPTLIHGLPAHVLLVHLVVILVPVAGLVLVAQGWSRPVRRWAGVGGPLLCLGALVMVPVTTNAGKWLRDHLPPELASSPLVKKHTDLGNGLLPWVIAMLVLSLAVWWLGRQPDNGRIPALLPVVVAVLATGVAVGAIVETYRIGDSGAQAVWTGAVVTK